MTARLKKQDKTELAAFRMPQELREAARDKCHRLDITFSQLMRRAVRRELSEVSDEEEKRGEK